MIQINSTPELIYQWQQNIEKCSNALVCKESEKHHKYHFKPISHSKYQRIKMTSTIENMEQLEL